MYYDELFLQRRAKIASALLKNDPLRKHINILDKDRSTALALAVCDPVVNYDLIKVLLEEGRADASPEYLIKHALHRKHHSLVNLLLAHGAPILPAVEASIINKNMQDLALME